MTSLFTVMAGGAIGAGMRYLAGLAVPMRGDWPLATLLVNSFGGFVMGLLMAYFLKGQVSETTRLLVGVGVLGGFTTFSAFSFEALSLIQRGQTGMALAYVLVSVILSIGATAAGFALVRA